MSDNITLPREVVEDVLYALVSEQSQGGDDCYADSITALRTALAAEQKKHPGYVIGSHWLETAYSRICAGEAEADVLRDIGLVRITDGTVETADIHAIVDRQEALRRDAERYRWLRERAWFQFEFEGRYGDSGETVQELDAAIDAAMGDKR